MDRLVAWANILASSSLIFSDVRKAQLVKAVGVGRIFTSSESGWGQEGLVPPPLSLYLFHNDYSKWWCLTV